MSHGISTWSMSAGMPVYTEMVEANGSPNVVWKSLPHLPWFQVKLAIGCRLWLFTKAARLSEFLFPNGKTFVVLKLKDKLVQALVIHGQRPSGTEPCPCCFSQNFEWIFFVLIVLCKASLRKEEQSRWY